VIRLEIALPDNLALGLHHLLHDDGGLRESAAQQLLSRHTPMDLQAWTEGVAGLGSVAGALTRALEAEGLLNLRGRQEEARRMAFEHVRWIARSDKSRKDA
jgi:hypothetical protein